MINKDRGLENTHEVQELGVSASVSGIRKFCLEQNVRLQVAVGGYTVSFEWEIRRDGFGRRFGSLTFA